MRLEKERIIARDPEALAGLQRIVRHCARIGAARANAQSLIDDVEQEVMMLVIERLIHVYDERRDVESFLIETCRRIALGLRRDHSREVLFSQGESEDRSDDWQENIADPETGDLAEVIDAENESRRAAGALLIAAALEEDAVTLAPLRVESEEDPKAPPPTPDPPRPQPIKEPAATEMPGGGAVDPSESRRKSFAWARGKRALPQIKPVKPSEEGVALRRIRLALSFSYNEMAAALDISPALLRAIEFGHRPKCPPGLLDRAQAIEAHSAEDRRIIETEAPALVRSWCERLGMDPEDYTGLARHIGTNRSTTFRWLRGQGSPTPRRIRAIEAAVQIEQERRLRMAQANPDQ